MSNDVPELLAALERGEPMEPRHGARRELRASAALFGISAASRRELGAHRVQCTVAAFVSVLASCSGSASAGDSLRGVGIDAELSADVPNASARHSLSTSYLVMDGGAFRVVLDPLPENEEIGLEFIEQVPANFSNYAIGATPGLVPGEHTARHTVSVSVVPSAVCARHANEIFIAGAPLRMDTSTTTNETMIEFLQVLPPNGAPYTIRSTANTPLGVAAPPSVIEAHVEGGLYRMPQDRSAPRIKRRLLGPYPFATAAMEVDPEGRFLLIAAPAEGRLYRLWLRPTPTLALVLDTHQAPDLASVESMFVSTFTDHVRRYVIACGSTYVVLGDSNNDGAFDSTETYTAGDYMLSFYGEYANLHESFRSYSFPGIFQ